MGIDIIQALGEEALTDAVVEDSLKRLNSRHRREDAIPDGSIPMIMMMAKRCLRNARTEVLILDELHHLVSSDVAEKTRWNVSEQIKTLTIGGVWRRRPGHFRDDPPAPAAGGRSLQRRRLRGVRRAAAGRLALGDGGTRRRGSPAWGADSQDHQTLAGLSSGGGNAPPPEKGERMNAIQAAEAIGTDVIGIRVFDKIGALPTNGEKVLRFNRADVEAFKRRYVLTNEIARKLDIPSRNVRSMLVDSGVTPAFNEDANRYLVWDRKAAKEALGR